MVEFDGSVVKLNGTCSAVGFESGMVWLRLTRVTSQDLSLEACPHLGKAILFVHDTIALWWCFFH